MRLLGYNMGNTLRTVSYTYFERFIDDDNFVLADCFSHLHWLDLDHDEYLYREFISNWGISAISTKLTLLVSLTVCLNNDVSSRSLENLPTCPAYLNTHF